MSKNQPAWNTEREAQLTELVGDESPVSLETVASISESMGNSTRSISSKLRKMEFEVEKVGEKNKTFTEDEEAKLESFVVANPGVYTFADIAEQVLGDVSMSKRVQGKLLSMELTDKVKKTEPKVVAKTYTDAEEAVISYMAGTGAYLEDIAEKLGKELNSVRGKCLSMLKSHGIKYPAQKYKKAAAKDVFDDLDNIEEMTVAEIAKAVDKTERGIKTMLTHRAITCSDYNGAKRAEKNAAKAA